MRIERERRPYSTVIWGEFGPGTTVHGTQTILWADPESETEKRQLFDTIVRIQPYVHDLIDKYIKQIDREIEKMQHQIDQHYCDQFYKWLNRNILWRFLFPKPERWVADRHDLHLAHLHADKGVTARWPNRPVSRDTEDFINQIDPQRYELFYTPIPKDVYEEIVRLRDRMGKGN